MGARPLAAEGVTWLQLRLRHGAVVLRRDRQSVRAGAETRRRGDEPMLSSSAAVTRGCTPRSNAAERGYSVVLLEAGRIGWGASGRNGGQVIPGWRKGASEAGDDIRRARAQRLFDLALEARADVLERIAKHAIACDLRMNGHLTCRSQASDLTWMRAEAETLARVMDYPHARVLDRSEARSEARLRRSFTAACSMACGGHCIRSIMRLASPTPRARRVSLLHEHSRGSPHRRQRALLWRTPTSGVGAGALRRAGVRCVARQDSNRASPGASCRWRIISSRRSRWRIRKR